MPHFSESQPGQAIFKRTMLPRAPACFFSDPKVPIIQFITSETGLNSSAVIHWAEKLSWKIKNGMAADTQ